MCEALMSRSDLKDKRNPIRMTSKRQIFAQYHSGENLLCFVTESKTGQNFWLLLYLGADCEITQENFYF